MKEMLRMLRGIFGAVASLSLGPGCATTEPIDTINLSYQSQAAVAPMPGAEAIQVKVTANDMRENKDWVCAQSGHRLENSRQAVGTFASASSPASLVSRAIKAELSHRGFDIDYRGIQVVANVSTFVCYPVPILSIGAEIEIGIFVYPAGRPPIGRELFYRYVKGEYLDGQSMRWTGENAKAVLEFALADAMKRLFSDRRFLSVISSAQAQGTAPAEKSSPRMASQPSAQPPTTSR
jgi:hypothetical protein